MPLPLVNERPFKSLRRSLDKGGVSVDSGRLIGERSSLSKIPVEILSLIFKHATYFEEDKRLAEVFLSHVCRYWCAVALNMATLWTSLAVDMSRQIPSVTFMLIRSQILTYLMRSKCSLIDIHLNISGTQRARHRIHLMDALVNHLARWRRLTVLTDSESQAFLIYRMLGDRYAPNLESVTVRLESPVTNNACISLEPVVFRKGAPKLNYVSLDISRARASIYPLYKILPSLRALSLHGDICGPPLDPIILCDLPLHNLRHLRLDGSPIITNLLMYLNAPNLESLVIEDVDLGHSSDTGEPAYPKDPSTCFPSLKYLTLSRADPTFPSSAIPIARTTGSIEHLVVAHYTFCIICDVGWTDEKGGIWPNLCSLTVCCGCTTGYGTGSSGGLTEPSYFLTGAQMRRGMTYRFMPDTLEGMRDNRLEDLNELMESCSIEEITCASGFPNAE